MRRLQLVIGLAVLGLLVARLGTGPFVAGLGALDGRSLLVVSVVTAATTVCGAWRWRLVARGLGLHLPLRTAVAASYRSQLLNSTLPGGVVGDVHRGVRHGRDVRQTGRALRAVGWERLWGQAVQVAVAVVVLLALPSPVRSSMPRVLLVAAVAVAVACLVVPLAVPVVRSDLRAMGGADWTSWAKGFYPVFTRKGLILDARNLYDPERMARLGFEYHAIGRRRP